MEHFPEVDESKVDDLSHPGALPLDVEKYRPYVDHFDITEEQKIKLLETLWSIMTAFVRHGFGVDSIQRCLPAFAEFSSPQESDELGKNLNAHEFNDTATEGKDD